MVITIEQASALDQALKAVSPRLYVVYLPPYQDLRGRRYQADYEIWCADPDDAEDAARLAAGTPYLRRSATATTVTISDKRRKMALAAATKALRAPAATVFAPPLEAVAEADYQPLRVDALTAEALAQRGQTAQARAAAQAARQDFTGLLDQDSLASNLLATILKHPEIRGTVSGDTRRFPGTMVITNNYTETVPLGVLNKQMDAFFDAHAQARVAPVDLGGSRRIDAGRPFLQARAGGAELFLMVAEGQPDPDERWYKMVVKNAAAYAAWLSVPDSLALIGWRLTALDGGGFEVEAVDD